ncbi:serine--tRNA ligase [Alkalicoccobacillus murimartini]|uniref:Serine--tRNA ligase n=1 Tax=Alkalicoccobacillus murimartini TaxID=171685 RepID=A0ABT9YLS9_9BACI|nr:serine--tRNA ligase [Alkalicoccobacillus murimartini]MDQ0208599.1 seryl-tRNA synthetase [Alkalicoccobacillus murimartini]
MLDIQYILSHTDEIQTVADQKGIKLSVESLVKTYEERRTLIQQIENMRATRNNLTKGISVLAREKNKAIEAKKEDVRELNQRIKEDEKHLNEVQNSYNGLMNLVPNIVSKDTPIGLSDEDNVEIKRVGEVREFNFAIKDHMELAEIHDMFDIPRGVKVAGTRNYFLKNKGLTLHRAVQQLALDVLHSKGFTLMDVPIMANRNVLYTSGFFPTGEDQTYHLTKDDKYLVGTSEVPLIGYYSNEVIDVKYPIKLAAVSNCFRREAGSGGRDVRGLYRVHQFAKVEQVILCKNDLDLSNRLLEEITNNAKEILNLLELPYRVVSVCTGDLSQKNYKQYDIETWMPSRESYNETHSSSNVLDFQTRRSSIRYKDEEGKTHYCYSLNNTAVATPRILIPLMENHQQEDGSIYIPKALRKYMYDEEYIKRSN